MWKRKACALSAAALFLIGMAGCAYPISKEWRAQARTDFPFAAVVQNPPAYVGAIVIWGGLIIRTDNAPSGADVIVLETALDRMETPEEPQTSQGRFIIRSPNFMDPAIYAPGRYVTVAGQISGKVTKPVGKVPYTYPVITIKQIYLWSVAPFQYYEYPYSDDWDWDADWGWGWGAPGYYNRGFEGGHGFDGGHGGPHGR